MKTLLILAVLAGIGVMAYMKYGDSLTLMPTGGVHIGATVAEVEKVWGKPTRVLPNFGNELRQYKAQSGKKYTCIFKDGELVEIHDE